MKERDIVRRLINRYRTRDPFELATFLDREVIPIPLKGVRGFYQYFQRNHLIYIDEELSGTIRNFVCCHELAHSILHADLNAVFLDSRTCFVTKKFEISADRFAADLLIPDDIVAEYANYSLHDLSAIWGVREEALRYRFENAQIGFKV